MGERREGWAIRAGEDPVVLASFVWGNAGAAFTPLVRRMVWSSFFRYHDMPKKDYLKRGKGGYWEGPREELIAEYESDGFRIVPVSITIEPRGEEHGESK